MAKAQTKEKECKHHFQPTGKKGAWSVKAISLNRRGKPRRERVPTTIFKCAKCGCKTEYPDYWERNFEVPKKSLIFTGKPAVAGKAS